MAWENAEKMREFLRGAQPRLESNPAKAAYFRSLKCAAQQPDLADGIHYVASPRHRLEVEHFSYRRRLQKLIEEMEEMG